MSENDPVRVKAEILAAHIVLKRLKAADPTRDFAEIKREAHADALRDLAVASADVPEAVRFYAEEAIDRMLIQEGPNEPPLRWGRSESRLSLERTRPLDEHCNGSVREDAPRLGRLRA
ncbi:hypothetical protein ACLBXM_20000 [Xanthobacteraceae bacterium A53D]